MLRNRFLQRLRDCNFQLETLKAVSIEVLTSQSRVKPKFLSALIVDPQ